MKILIAAGTLYLSTVASFAQSNPNDHYVNGYTNQYGTQVQPHYQTNPNSTTNDNYGTRGNFNPHTDSYGTRSPY